MPYLIEGLLPIGRRPVIRRTSEMDVRTQRQDARRRAREARSEPDKARKARDKRLEDLAVKVLVAMDTVAEQERRAGEALRVMVEEEGLSLREAVGWCGDEVSVHTAARFKRLVSDRSEDEGPGDDAGSVQGAPGENAGDEISNEVDEVDDAPAGNEANVDTEGSAVCGRL